MSRRNLLREALLRKPSSHLAAEESGRRFDVDEEVDSWRVASAGRQPREHATRREKVNMRIIAQISGPGLEDADRANLTADEARILCHCCEGSGCRTKEQILDSLLVRVRAISRKTAAK